MARILVVSDDEQDYRVVSAAVSGQSHFLTHTASGIDGCISAAETRPDVVIVGERTRDQEGLSVVRHLRHNLEIDSHLVLSMDDDEPAQRIAAYEAGVDGTLPRPLNIAEVGLRLKALLRHSQAQAAGDCVIIGNLRLDKSARLLYVEDRRVELTPSEFTVLSILMDEPGRTFSADELLDTIWDCDTATTANVRMRIMGLRRKVEADPRRPQYIQNVQGFGYRVSGGRGV